MNIDFSNIAQTCIAALLVGAGGLLYKATITLTSLQRDLAAHTKQDAENFSELRAADARIEEVLLKPRRMRRKR